MPLLAQSQLVTGLMLGALALVIGWLLLRTHRSLSRLRRDDSPRLRAAPPQQGDPGHHLDAPSQLLRWEVQMHQTARDLSAQLDSKMGALQSLIAEADRAAARLEAAARLPHPLPNQPHKLRPCELPACRITRPAKRRTYRGGAGRRSTLWPTTAWTPRRSPDARAAPWARWN